ncbi:MAG: GNAT family N-acetyltransferase [Acetobacteraceae bacterium]|nr:GNAT family N-acetyltransferase [Acetobacteraceae bacterium]
MPHHASIRSIVPVAGESSPRGLEVRPVMAADLPAVTQIQTEVMRRGHVASVGGPLDLRAITALRERLVVQGYPCLIALRDGQPVGFAFAQAFGERACWHGVVEGTVAVHPDAAGQGVGRALLRALIAACEAKRHRQMIGVLDGGAAGEALVGLYQALGFSHAGVLRGVGLKLGAAVDSLLMQRSLGPARAERDAA